MHKSLIALMTFFANERGHEITDDNCYRSASMACVKHFSIPFEYKLSNNEIVPGANGFRVRLVWVGSFSHQS